MSNSLATLDALRDGGRMSRADLAQILTLSNQGLAQILHDLVESGRVVEVAVQSSHRLPGRPALQYEFNPMQFCVISLYVGLRYSELTLCDALGQPLTEHVEFYPGWNVAQIVEEAAILIEDLRASHRVAHIPLHLGVVVHGSVHSVSGVVNSARMGWRAVPLAELLAKHIDGVITVHDASRAAAIAESREGMAVGIGRAVVLNFGPEIIATHLIDGAPDAGATGLAGRVDRNYVWHEGQLRKFDEIQGDQAIKDRYTKLSGQPIEWATEVIKRAVEGDPDAEEAMAFGIDAIAYVSMWLITIANPERFIMTGAAGDYPERWRSRIRARILELVNPEMFEAAVQIDFTEIGRQAWVRGGVHAVLDHQRRTQ